MSKLRDIDSFLDLYRGNRKYSDENPEKLIQNLK